MKHFDDVMESLNKAQSEMIEAEKHVEALEDILRRVYAYCPAHLHKEINSLLVKEKV